MLGVNLNVRGSLAGYAANAVVYWPAETLRAKFDVNCTAKGRDPVTLVQELLNLASDEGAGVEAFWNKVKTNLQAGRIRLVFLADKIPTELQRIVEFLNVQMDPAEVLAIELRQFVGKDFKTMVPRVFGLTAGATGRKRGVPGEARQWDERSFFEELIAQGGGDTVDTARAILDWVRRKVSRIWWGQGRELGSFVPILDLAGKKIHFFAVWTTATVEIYFQHLQGKPPFDSEEKRRELLNRLNEIPGFNLTDEAITRRPTRPLTLLRVPSSLKLFQETIEWGLAEVQQIK
jgi:hypothetical protein